VGPAAIRASFEAIFANGGIPVVPQQVHRLHQLGAALHHLVERIEVITAEGRQVGWVVATNVYVKAAQGWRLAAHHASPAEPQEPAVASAEGPNTLH
jgi:ketosteroid isomerase-like protein